MALETDIGPLDWRIGVVDNSGRPTPEFQRRWNTQRGNNSLIGSLATGSGAPTGTPTEGEGYIDINATPPVFYVGNAGMWEKVGVFKFTDLTDAPHTYSGQGLSFVQVNGGATGLIFTTLSAGLDEFGTPVQGDILYRGVTGWLLLAPGTAGQVLSTGGPSANPSWINPPSSIFPWPLTLGNSNPITLVDDGAGVLIIIPFSGQI